MPLGRPIELGTGQHLFVFWTKTGKTPAKLPRNTQGKALEASDIDAEIQSFPLKLVPIPTRTREC